ncbi:MAG: hypothetical protein ABIP30_08045 [Ferruginibacter sp.]
MKKIAVLSLAFAALSLSVSAQQKREIKGEKQGMYRMHGQRHHKMDMMKNMNFSDAQKAQLKANREEYKQKMHALNNQENITVKEQRDRKTALRNEQKAKYQALITPEQKTKMAEARNQMQAKRKEMGAKRMDMMRSKLALSDDQLSKLKAQQEATHSQMKALKDDQSLSREDKMAKIKSIKQASKDQRKSIFTTNQLKKMDEMKKDRKDWKQSKK